MSSTKILNGSPSKVHSLHYDDESISRDALIAELLESFGKLLKTTGAGNALLVEVEDGKGGPEENRGTFGEE